MSVERDQRKQMSYDKAIEVNTISMKYHLSHAMLACDVMLQDLFKIKFKQMLKEINVKKEEALIAGKSTEFKKLLEQEKAIRDRSPFRIFVGYLDIDEVDSARTICIEDQILIYLSKKLLDISLAPDGFYTKHVVKLREKMAHELGHAILHTDALYDAQYRTTGTNDSTFKGDKEDEANWFAEKLLELRHERNMKMKNKGIIDKYF